jgi:tRNA pseudouridine55 synthase
MEIPNHEQYLEGAVILVDKPLHWTSFDVVKKIRNTIKVKKIGHAGTLDPLATGLLILCTGKFTKKIDTYQGQEKEYTGTFELGKTTPSYDLETEFDQVKDCSHINLDQILAAANKQTGIIHQMPPQFSAIKVNGVPIYKSARKNVEVKIEPREVEIKLFEIVDFQNPTITFRIVCSKGTYIRSIANDIGQELGVGAHLSSLRRTRIGEFEASSAWQLDDFVTENKKSNEGD